MTHEEKLLKLNEKIAGGEIPRLVYVETQKREMRTGKIKNAMADVSRNLSTYQKSEYVSDWISAIERAISALVDARDEAKRIDIQDDYLDLILTYMESETK